MRRLVAAAKLVAAVLIIIVSPPVLVYAGPFAYGIASDIAAAPAALAFVALAVAGLIVLNARRRVPAQAAAKSIT